MPTVAKFLAPDWGDKVDSGKGIVVPARQVTQAAVRRPYAGVNFIPPVRDYEFFTTVPGRKV